jgi:hypothetical protein
VERGATRKAPTWHQSDLGVELLGDDVVLSQLADVDDNAGTCILFDMVADVASDATVTFSMDLFGDGEVDYQRQLPTSGWALLTYVVRAPARYQGIVFRLAKSGPGRAVLAQMRARAVDDDECRGAEALDQPAVPLGGACYGFDPDNPFAGDPDLCESGVCWVAVPAAYLPLACSECDADADCAGGVCGVAARVPRFLDPYRACVAPASRALGELCYADDECATGVCCGGVCSGCCEADGRECADGRACEGAARGDELAGPSQCDPGGRSGGPGEPCLADEDCASGECGGDEVLRVCPADGRLCAEDADCPPDQAAAAEEREFGSCVALGTAGGSCR